MIFLCKKLGRFSIEKQFYDYVDKLPDGTYQISFSDLKRTTQQNRYYWSYLRLIAIETGDNENDLHEFFKRKFLPPKIVKVMGKYIKLPASTTNLNKKDFGEYIEKISILTDVPLI